MDDDSELHPPSVTPEHFELTALLPWYVNGTLEECDRQELDRHLAHCNACRADLLLEQRLHREMADERAAVEYLATPSLQRLRKMLDGLEPAAAAAGAPSVPEPRAADPRPHRARPGRRGGYAVAASLLVAALLAWVIAVRGPNHTVSDVAAPYQTVTESAPRAHDEAVRAVFTPSITLVRLQSILDEAGLRIISGPSEAGVYSLAVTPASRSVAESLASLRRHPEVRFAERTAGDLESPTRAPPPPGS